MRDGALLVPVTQFAAVALLTAGTRRPASLFLLLGPVVSLALSEDGAASSLAVLGTAGTLLVP